MAQAAKAAWLANRPASPYNPGTQTNLKPNVLLAGLYRNCCIAALT